MHSQSQNISVTKQNANQVEKQDLDAICSALSAELERAAGRSIAITGGAGFLGFYLTKTLLHWNSLYGDREPIDIQLYDTFMRGKPDWIEECEALANFTVMQRDITDEPSAELSQASYIIHAASIASPIYYREHPVETMDANVIGLRRLLDVANKRQATTNPVAGLLYFSTSEIYGDPDAGNIPTPETYRGNVSWTGPRACYDESKRYGETLSVNFARQYGIPVTIARPFNNYGPGLKITDRRAPPDFARDILAGNDIVLLSDGTPTRTFCYIADAIVGYFKVLFNGRPGESYNIGNDSPEVSIRHFAQLNIDAARELFDYTGSLRFANSEDTDYLTDNPHRRCPDISKARSEIGFNPDTKLEDGIKRSLQWYAGNSSAEEN